MAFVVGPGVSGGCERRCGVKTSAWGWLWGKGDVYLDGKIPVDLPSLVVDDISKSFVRRPKKKGMGGDSVVQAVNHLSFTAGRGQIFGTEERIQEMISSFVSLSLMERSCRIGDLSRYFMLREGRI